MADEKPIRLRAEYATASATVNELTRALATGGVTLETKNPLPLGTRFQFELSSPELPTKLALVGEVTQVIEHTIDVDGAKRFGMVVEYRFENEEERARVEAAVGTILSADPNEIRREYPRVPTAYRVREVDDPLGTSYQMRNLSEGGMLLETDAPELGGETLMIGTRARVEITASGRVYAILGTVVWVAGMRSSGKNAFFGVQFDPGTRAIIKDMMAMRVVPDAITIAFG